MEAVDPSSVSWGKGGGGAVKRAPAEASLNGQKSNLFEKFNQTFFQQWGYAPALPNQGWPEGEVGRRTRARAHEKGPPPFSKKQNFLKNKFWRKVWKKRVCRQLTTESDSGPHLAYEGRERKKVDHCCIKLATTFICGFKHVFDKFSTAIACILCDEEFFSLITACRRAPNFRKCNAQ